MQFCGQAAGLYPYPADCRYFVRCGGGDNRSAVQHMCLDNTHFDIYTSMCLAVD